MSTSQLISDIEAFARSGGTLSTASVTKILMDRFSSDADFRVAGSTSTMLYSGKVGSVTSNSLAKDIADRSGGRIGIIDNTAAGRALAGDSGNPFAVRETIVNLLKERTPGLPEADAVNTANRILYGDGSIGQRGVWDAASERFVDLANGPIKTITPEATDAGVFARTELPRLLDSGRKGLIDGISLDDLRARVAADTSDGIAKGVTPDRARTQAVDNARIAIAAKSYDDLASSGSVFGVNSDGSGNRTPALAVGDDFLRRGGITDTSLASHSNFQNPRSAFDTLGKLDNSNLPNFARASKYLDALGVAGDVIDIGSTLWQAKQLYDQGDNRGAANALATGLGEFAGGALGVGAVALLGLSGPIGLAAGLALGYLGSELGGGLADRLFDWFTGDDWTDGVGNSYSNAIRDQLRRLIDPIVLDLDGNGIELISRAMSTIYFDMDGDGIKELTGWVKPTDGLLVLDSNANGYIDDINELIGDLGRSGFTELVTYDLNNDRVINASDSVWGQFRVWLDANSNGLTDAGELKTLASLNIQSIDLRYTAVSFTAEGNRIHEQSIFEYTNGTTGLVADIWFDVSNIATNSSAGLTGNITVDRLPDIRGRGDVRSLRSAMLFDGALATLVTGFVTQSTSSLVNARSQVEQIIYRWSGVQSVDPTSRGTFFDGRRLAALEAFLGTPFNVQGNRNPNAQAVANLTASWNGLVDGILSRLIISGSLGSAIANIASYDPETDRLLTLQTPSELLSSFRLLAPTGEGVTVAGYWAAVLPLARQIIQDGGGDPSSPAFTAAVASALQNTGLTRFSDLLNNGIVPLVLNRSLLQTPGVFQLSSGNDTLWLNQDRHAVYGSDGDDFIAVEPTSAQPQLMDGGPDNDQLYAGSADDWIDGGSGADIMSGGGGNDTYTVDDGGDVVVETPGSGEDHVRSTMTYLLASDVEHLTLLGTGAINGFGNAAANRITGNSAANRMEGQAGNDTLDGGAGADTMVGGLGTDFYRVDDNGDVIFEIGTDSDTVEASLNYTLAARVENLVLIGSALNGTGNALNNRLTGNALNNILNGGVGNDLMEGGLGDDIYLVDSISDWITESANAGTDTVRSTTSFTLGSNLENLELLGSVDINASGNSIDNHITGNSGDNRVDGGSGADTMVGGSGDDTYVVDHAADVVTEAASAGTDSVETTVAAYTLTANVDRLQLFINWNDNVNRAGTGNDLANLMTGSNGNNILSGLGGDDQLFGNNGNDTLLGGNGNDWMDGGLGDDRAEGGAGDDRYVVNSSLDVVVEAEASGADTVESSVSFILGVNVENLLLLGHSWDALDGQGNSLNNRLTGNNGVNNLDGGAGADTMTGGGGNDTYTVDDGGDVVVEDPGSGEDHVRSTMTYLLASDLEHLTLLGTADINGFGNAAANRITGNSAANRMEGQAGNDTLDGGAGADTMFGGLGSDLYRVDDSGDVILEIGTDLDTVEASLTYTLAARVENLVLTGSALNATGNVLNNRLTGNPLNNILNGGVGNDSMEGGLGDDIYIVDSPGDWIRELANAGTDMVWASISFTLGSNFEHLELLGSEDINASGNSSDNRIMGNLGDNRLDGGSGADTMAGGGGDDVYIVDNAADIVIEAASDGVDSVETTLAAYSLMANVDQLRLFIGSNDNVNRDGTGNDLANLMTGSNGNNTLSGLEGDDLLFGNNGHDTLLGGDGNDWLDGGLGGDRAEGGAGDDRYVVNSSLDIVVEAEASGADTVESSVSFVLGENIENLLLLGQPSDALDGQGNSLNNRLTGNNGTNNLGGGAGADTMIGGGGNDTYTVDDVGDVVVEYQASGTDLVRTSISYALVSFVENLTLLGAANLNATGNLFANNIVGNAGNNVITGGLGSDSLTGGEGSDVFSFPFIVDSGATNASADLITDFNPSQLDLIDLALIDAVESTAADEMFTYIGSSVFTAPGQARSFVSGGKTFIALNTNAELSGAEMLIAISGAPVLQTSNFIL